MYEFIGHRVYGFILLIYEFIYVYELIGHRVHEYVLFNE